MTAILFSALAALGGGLVMGVTGFGAGMVIMMALPVFYSLTESAALTGIVCTVLNAQMAIRYWKHRLTRAHREKQLKMSCQALHNAPPNRT